MLLADYILLYCTSRYLTARVAIASKDFLGKPVLKLLDTRNAHVGMELQGRLDHVLRYRCRR